MLRVLGVKGVIRRFRGSAQSSRQPLPSLWGFQFPHSLTVSDDDLRVGIMIHVFYVDLVDELAALIRNMPVRYTLLVSVVNNDAAIKCESAFRSLPKLMELSIKVVVNRGRDIAPLLVDFREEVQKLDVVAHLHTKKSLYTGSKQTNWRRYLQQLLFGNSERISWILGMFVAEPRLGIVYPETYKVLPLWAHTWLGNMAIGQAIGNAISLNIEPQRYFDYPAGSMFWARVNALRPLLDLKLSEQDFPEETGQTDGTTQHAIERLFVLAARDAGFLSGILPTNGELSLHDEGERNWRGYFQESLVERIKFGVLEASIVSVDIFDTLVTRPFLYAAGARAYLADLARSTLDIDDFVSLRQRGEQLARARSGKDVNLKQVYEAMQDLAGSPEAATLEALRELELLTEARMLKPRQQVLQAVKMLRMDGHRIVAVSDMYLDQADLQRTLPPSVWTLPSRCYVSCETQYRKDDGSAWTTLPAIEGVPVNRWLHIGDNERSDIQLPQDHGYLTPIHVLRSDALLDVVPALRPLRPSDGTSAHWHDQLLLGLITRHLADVVDRDPHCVMEGFEISSPRSLGYLVLGPLITDYTCWLARLALEKGASQVLFLAREGHLLSQAFKLLQQASSRIAGLQGDYLLASRRGVGMPSLRTAEDIDALLASTFQGTLHQLLQSRMGQEAAAAVARVLGEPATQETVFLPEMRSSVQARLSPAVDVLLAAAEDERSSYLEYWSSIASTDSLLLADIGYSGTIQKLLSRVTGRPLDGAYFAVNERVAELKDSGCRAWARYGDARSELTSSSDVLRHDLLLEALLTAPQGQFLRFQKSSAGVLSSKHMPHEVSPDGLHHIQEIHQGALDFVRDACEVVGEDTFKLDFDRALAQTPLRCLGEGIWNAGPWMAAIQIEDHYTGRGAVTAAHARQDRIKPS